MSSHCKDLSTSRYLGAPPGPGGERTEPQREHLEGNNSPLEGNISPSSSLETDPWPSDWLVAESLKRPCPLSQLRARVQNSITHRFLRRTFLHFCQGPQKGGWFPRPRAALAYTTHRPMADRCPGALVQLSISRAPSCQRRLQGEGQEPQGGEGGGGNPSFQQNFHLQYNNLHIEIIFFLFSLSPALFNFVFCLLDRHKTTSVCK